MILSIYQMFFKNWQFIIKLFFYISIGFSLYLLFKITNQLISIIIVSSIIFLIILFSFWYKEKKYYTQLMEQINKETSHKKLNLIICPKCKGIQSAGLNFCQICLSEWITCKVCLQPFEDGSSVLISPCCGMGFHPSHFESALRENGYCPFCQSIDVIMESNW